MSYVMMGNKYSFRRFLLSKSAVIDIEHFKLYSNKQQMFEHPQVMTNFQRFIF